MIEALIVDNSYKNLSTHNIDQLKNEFSKIGINMSEKKLKNEKELIKGCKNTDIILCTGNPSITRQVIEQLPKLKIILRFGIGVNSIDLDAATEHEIAVVYMPGYCSRELSQHASALILNIMRNITIYDSSVRQHKWLKGSLNLPKDIGQITLGILGFGNSGSELYKIFHNGLGTKVITHDPYVSQEKIKESFDVDFVNFEELLNQSDIISIHAPLTDETHHLFNRNSFRKMKKEAILINVARGPIVKEYDLIQALGNKTIYFAGLDVFEHEPPLKDNPLLQMENVLLTPHSGYYGEKAIKNQINWAIDLIDLIINKNKIPQKYIANTDVITTLLNK